MVRRRGKKLRNLPVLAVNDFVYTDEYDQEAFLLRTRMQKMPYKQIAAQLKKTELACRLHYHQLAHGSHRRRRTSSVCSIGSTRSADVALSMSRYHVNHEYAPITPAHSPRLGSPINTLQGASPANRFSAVNSSPAHGLSSKMLLPKPHLLKQTTSRSATPDSLNGSAIGGPLRINTADVLLARGASLSVPPQPGTKVNVEKLRAIYESRRQAFWADIAAEYGADVTAAELEHVWRHGTHLSRPPTPDDSPDSNVGSVTSVSSTDRARSVNNNHSEAGSARRTSSPRYELPRPNTQSSLHSFAPSVHQHLKEQRSQSEQPQQHHHPLAACSNSAVEPIQARTFSPISNATSAVSAPDRTPFVLPTPNLMPRSWAPASTSPPVQQRSGASTPHNGVPATSISALLNEEKWPTRETSVEPIAVS